MSRPAHVEQLHELPRGGDSAAMLALCRDYLDQLAASPGDTYPESALAHEDLAAVYHQMEDEFGAAFEYERALQVHRRSGHTVNVDVARCLGMLGRCYLWTGRTAQGEQNLYEALTLLDHLPLDQQTPRGFILVDLAQLHIWDKEYVAAEQLLHEAVRQHLRNMGHCPDRLAFVFSHLSCAYEGQRKITAANRAIEKAIGFFSRCKDTEHFGYAALLTAKGVFTGRQGWTATARESHLEALAILERVRPKGSLLTERVKCRLAKLGELAQPV